MSRIEFPTRSGLSLAGTLELPPGGNWQATALFAHCFTCGRDIRAARTITRALAAQGFAVLRFDFTGLGESEGDFADTSFSSNLDDLEDAAAWLAEHLAGPQLLLGHSLGGTAVLAVAERIASVRAVATLGAPGSPEHVLKQFGDDLETIGKKGSAEVSLGGRDFHIRRDFIDDAREHQLAERLRALRRALLVMHSPVDTIVSIDQAQQIFIAAMHPKSFVSLDDADHLLSREADARYAADVVAAWAARFLESADVSRDDAVLIRGRTADRFTCSVQTGPHRLIADEPASSGGAALGPDPYAYLCAALGACTVMTLNMYARHKKLPLERVSCEVSHQRIHLEDCEDCEASERRVDELSRVISIEGDVSEAQERRLLEIADRCPIHLTLEGRIQVRSTLNRGTGS
ncbi:MAG: OsmC family protein [Gammaproteobacteria bacterium]|nr:OsmC family protein [Gammaproteobacteria bacterium]